MSITIFIALVAAAAVSLVAWRSGALTSGGALVATMVGTLTFAAGGLAWSAILLLFFVTSSVLSALPRPASVQDMEKGEPRDSMQVIANGGVAVAAALLSLLHQSAAMDAAFAGSVAAATSDTWATEIGTRFGGPPRSLISRDRVPPGVSGAVTRAGLVASLAGASIVALGAGLLLDARTGVAAALGGVAGSLADSVLGATVQNRGYCPVCQSTTEQPIHTDCGSRTRSIGGVSWIQNDVVNLAATLIGAITAEGFRAVL